MKASKIRDIYFGEMSLGKSGAYEIPLERVQRILNKSNGKDVAGQLNRLISQIGGKLTIAVEADHAGAQTYPKTAARRALKKSPDSNNGRVNS